MAMASPPSPDALLSQELFDETVLENEECFDLSPDEALRETIDQFRRQLGALVAAGGGDVIGVGIAGAASPTSVAGGGAGDAAAEDGGSPPPPAALSHLVLSHPESPEGRRERADRASFQNCLASLDERVGADGTVAILRDADGGGGGGERVMEALAEVGRRCRAGDPDGGGGGETSESKTKNDNANDNDRGNNRGDGSPLPYLAILQRTSSIYTLMSFLGVVDPVALRGGAGGETEERLRILEAVARSLSSVLSDGGSGGSGVGDPARCAALRAELRDAFVPALGRVVCLIAGTVQRIASAAGADEAHSSSVALRSCCRSLLRLGADATRGCEGGKAAFVRSALPPELSGDDDPAARGARRGGVATVLACLSLLRIKADCTQIIANDASERNPLDNSQLMPLLTECCRLLASLCRCDDFRDPAPGTAAAAAGVNASSAHDHAMEFHRAGAVPPLVDIARGALSKWDDGIESAAADDERLAAAALVALRTLALNDEIVQTTVALGVLPVLAQALRIGASVAESWTGDGGGDPARTPRLVAASLGLLRNLCGNDEIKTSLCLGTSSSPPVLLDLLRSMRLCPSAAIVQEHGCGALAAMALRRPANARAILDADGPRRVIAAMRRHGGNVGVQRQGALAVRNVASRLLRDASGDGDGGDGSGASSGSGEQSLVRDAFLDLGAEEVLREIAGRHQGSVDEAYAALRDLGCAVSLVKFDAEDLRGERSGVSRTMMFGEKHNSNFRPVYEESAGLSESVDNAVSQFEG